MKNTTLPSVSEIKEHFNLTDEDMFELQKQLKEYIEFCDKVKIQTVPTPFSDFFPAKAFLLPLDTMSIKF